MKLLVLLMRITTALHRKVSVAVAPKTFEAQAKGQEKPCLMDSVRARRQEKANRERSIRSPGRAFDRQDTPGIRYGIIGTAQFETWYVHRKAEVARNRSSGRLHRNIGEF
ncbi:hypothetical protein M409DRAFT_54674 [Zasmidium cellare ATCC 36951]|uniref:Secreted protein n=1 Tax=Zasmidium cellare ATCC 36951 TaxID=1080233 RepID=A0A6A6CI56_ZASCE|nr:uncharacterized protein M409DRAFT_54674 [Zasmidium cellare ATCC 36951]KAF2166904.1 hypothetical protein M409DRAFT_54674 [Zasmidium cellare ATCC 36951]